MFDNLTTLEDCVIGDWVKFQHSHEYFYLGVVTDITDSGFYCIDYKAKFDNRKYIWIYPPEYLNGSHNPNNHYISKYKPTIQEIFEINKLKENKCVNIILTK